MDEEDIGVSPIELFFDLVFVFTITQLTNLLLADPTGVGVAHVMLIFGNVWWMYGGYAWLTNAVPPRQTVVRLLMLVGMGGFLVVALAIPHAFGGSGPAFAVGYLVVTFVHTGLFLRSSEEGAVRAMFRLGPYNTITAALLVAAGLADGGARWSLWVAAFVLHWASPAFTAVGGFRIRAGHFVERHGLIVLIALGESVVAVGIGLQGRELTGGLIITALLSLGLGAALWWLYFDGEDERAERALDGASATRSPWLALFAFGYVFLPLLGGIVILATGVKEAVLSYGEPASTATAWFLAAGTSAYLLALVLLRWVLGTGTLISRLLMAAAALLTVVAGREISSEAQIGLLTAILATGIAIEARRPAGVALP